MNRPRLCSICALTMVIFAAPAWAQRAPDTVSKSYWDAFGRNATDGERNYWLNQRNDWNSQQDLVNLHAQYIKTNPTVRQDLINQTYMQAFGRNPNDGERNYWANQRSDWKTHKDLMALHMAGLKSNPGLQEDAVNAIFARIKLQPTQAVKDHWKRQLASNPRPQNTLVNEMAQWGIQRTAMIVGSYNTAIGRKPTQPEITYWLGRIDYNSQQDLIKLHRDSLKTNPALVDEVVKASYLKVFNYAPNPNGGEYKHWRPIVARGHHFTEVCNLHEEWKRKNVQPAKSNPQLMSAVSAQGLIMDAVGNLLKNVPGGDKLYPAGTWLLENQGAITSIIHNGTKVVSSAK